MWRVDLSYPDLQGLNSFRWEDITASEPCFPQTPVPFRSQNGKIGPPP